MYLNVTSGLSDSSRSEFVVVIRVTTKLLLEFNTASVGKCHGLDLMQWWLGCRVNFYGFSMDLKSPYGSISVWFWGC